GVNADDLKNQLIESFKITKNRAELISIDQISKLNSEMEMQRMAAVGGRVYQWADMEDGRVRTVHALRDNKYYDATKSAGHNAGQEIHCRCYKRWVHPDDVKNIDNVRVLTSTRDY
ncbi:MAG: phage minor head protein, partial [Vibrio sp.]